MERGREIRGVNAFRKNQGFFWEDRNFRPHIFADFPGFPVVILMGISGPLGEGYGGSEGRKKSKISKSPKTPPNGIKWCLGGLWVGFECFFDDCWEIAPSIGALVRVAH